MTEFSVQVTQPQGQMTVISSQPGQITDVNRPRGIPRDWSTSLFSCHEDIGSCVLGLFFHPCATACLATNMGEPCCTACCAGLLPMRTNFRGKHNLQGSIINDCCTVMFCGPCASCQMHRELNNMKAGRAEP